MPESGEIGQCSNNDCEKSAVSLSRASSSSGIDGLDFIDPDAVDFEPLLVSGTGKILSYHDSSFYDYDDFEEDKSIESCSNSVSTPITSNVTMQAATFELKGLLNRHTPNMPNVSISTNILPSSQNFLHSHSSAQMRRWSFRVIAIAFILCVGLNSGITDFQLETDTLKPTIIADIDNEVLYRNMMNVDVVLSSMATSMVLWLPAFSASSDSKELLDIIAKMIPQCFSRSVFYSEIDVGSGLVPVSVNGLDTAPVQKYLTDDADPLPGVIVTPFFRNAATTLFDNNHLGIFLTMLSDPIISYAKDYSSPFTKHETDNLLVRYLAGTTHKEWSTTQSDYENAISMLRTRFILLSCEDPLESLRRLSYFRHRLDFSQHIIGRSSSCLKEQFNFEKECESRNIAQKRYMRLKPEVLNSLKAKHSYDISLYEYSVALFDEQKLLFGDGEST